MPVGKDEAGASLRDAAAGRTCPRPAFLSKERSLGCRRRHFRRHLPFVLAARRGAGRSDPQQCATGAFDGDLRRTDGPPLAHHELSAGLFLF